MTRRTIVGILLAVTFALAGPKLTLPASETGPMTISFSQGYSFDPLVELPKLPPNLTIEGYDGEYGYYIVQFPGPVRPEWKAAAERAGAELLWYLPNYAFIARIANDRAATVAALSEVRWLGLYQPAFKLLRGLEKASGRCPLIVVFFKAEDKDQLLDQLAALGAENITPEFNQWNSSVKLDIDASMIPAVARLPGVYWIEIWGEITPDNADCQWVDMHGYSPSDTSRTIWAKGVTGSSVVVALTDQRLWHGHDLFRDPVNNTPGPTHRKVIHYFGTMGAESHGTHTSGTLCGNDEPVGGTSLNDGLAKDSRLYFQYYSSFPTGWDMNVWFAGPESGVAGLRAFNHSMSLSRKDTYNIYVFSDMTADQFVWNHRQFLHCNSMGNLTTNQMGHPVIAKNIISTGGTQNGTSCRGFYTSSSRGPTADGRRKPQLVSPAVNVYSASHTNASSYVSMSGTSMATPNMTGSMALIRDYFRKGFYPTGDTLTGTPMELSAALNKAVGIVGADNDISGYTVPDNNVGWGRVDLDSSLHFAGDRSKLWVMDDTVGLETADSAVFTINVVGDSRPFRVALCWSDYPGTMQAALILVNNLDLTVISPTGTEYKGNVWSGGQSQTGGSYDTLNVEECFRRNSPELGVWTVKVKARNVPQGPQPFALAAIGMFEEAAPPALDVGVTAIIAPVGEIDSGETVTPVAVVKNFGTEPADFIVRFLIGEDYEDTLDLALEPGESDTVEFEDWDALEPGTFVVRCIAELEGDERPANNELADSVRVLPATGITQGLARPYVFSLQKALPNPFNRTMAVRYSLPRTSLAKLSVYSAAGMLVRRLVNGPAAAGWHTAVWNGRDDQNQLVSAGLYILRLEAGDRTATQKLVLQH